MKKHVISVLLCMTLSVTALTACGNQAGSVTETPVAETDKETAQDQPEENAANTGEKTMIVASNSDCVTFAPWGQQGGGRKAVRRALYETLAYMNADGTVSLDLAKEINEVSDGVYDIEIYDYIVDTAGNPMTASDVVFSFKKAEESGVYAAYLDNLESIEATGDYTVQLTFTNEKVGGLYTMLDYIYIVTEASFEQSGDEMVANPIGTTSYVLDSYVAGSSIKFKKVDTYWQTEELTIDALKANLDSFEWTIISEKSQHSIALETGGIDATNSVLAADYGNFVDDSGNPKDGYGFVESVHTGLLTLVFNCSDDSMCKDENLRKAISYAIDTASMAQAGYGSAGVAADCFSSPVYRDYDESWKDADYYAYNVEQAKQYLAQSDYAGEELVLLTQSDSELTSQATLVQAFCDAVGIKIKVEYYDTNLYTSYRDDMNYHFDLDLEYVNATYYTYELLSYLTDYTYENGTGRMRISDPELTALYDKASAKSTSNAQAVQDCLNYIKEHCYALPVAYYTQKVFYNADKVEELGVTSDSFNPTPYTSTLK